MVQEGFYFISLCGVKQLFEVVRIWSQLSCKRVL